VLRENLLADRVGCERCFELFWWSGDGDNVVALAEQCAPHWFKISAVERCQIEGEERHAPGGCDGTVGTDLARCFCSSIRAFLRRLGLS
jgi:hypothetical protein